MISIKADIYKKDRDFYDYSLSSVEDVYKTLWFLDIIYQEKENGNTEAMAIYNDLAELFNQNKVCDTYLKIQTGKIPLSHNDYGKEIIEIVAKKLKMGRYECEKILNESIKKVVEMNFEKWEKCVNQRFKGEVIASSYSCEKDDEKLKQLDYNIKYKNSTSYVESEYPDDLKTLIDIQKSIKDKIKNLKNKKRLNKKDKEQLRKLTTYHIDVCKDISILKEHYKIPIANTNKKGSLEFTSYDENFGFLYEDDEDYTVQALELKNDKLENEYSIWRIKQIAKEVLTKKQLVIFNLYYIAGMTQQEIGDLLGMTKQAVNDFTKKIITKIKNNI